MIKNYFFLSRLAFELRSLIKDKIILESFTAEKDKLSIKLHDEFETVIEFCVNHTLPYFQKRQNISRKKRYSTDIFPEIVNLKFSDIFIASNDRVLLFQIENELSLFYAIRGKFTNLYLLNNDTLTSFKKTLEEDLAKIKNEFQSLCFVNPLSLPEFQQEDENLSFEQLKKKYPFLTSDVLFNSEKNDKIPIQTIKENIKKIFHSNLFLIKNNSEKTVEISPIIKNNNQNSEVKEFDSVINITSAYLKELSYFEEFKNLENYLSKHISKELSNIIKKKENISARREIGNREDYFRTVAELLLINKSKLNPGMSEIELQDIYSNNEVIIIPLNKKLSPQENIEHYFKRAKEEKHFFERSAKIISDIDQRILLLKNSSEKLNTAKSIEDLKLIMKEIGIKMKQSVNVKQEEKIKFRHYIIENKYNVYVGKDSKSNDLLTLKFAKPNDYWFHARSVSGSHVVLRVDNKNEAIPKSVLKKVASIAAFYSKAKSSSLVPVSYTLKKYVVKKKGMDVGQVALLRENTLLVKPEIPEDSTIAEQE